MIHLGGAAYLKNGFLRKWEKGATPVSPAVMDHTLSVYASIVADCSTSFEDEIQSPPRIVEAV